MTKSTKQPPGNETEVARTRIVGMKWLKLGEDKDPAFEKVLFLAHVNDSGKVEQWAAGELKGIEIEPKGKVYKFTRQGDDPTEFHTGFTHYAYPTIPV